MKQKTFYAFVLSMLITTLAWGQKVGNDADSHGCRASAGNTYSHILDHCIRSWEQKIKLSGIGAGNEGFIAAVIFSKDKKKAEVFLKDYKEGTVLSRKGKTTKYVLASERLELTVSKGYSLKKDGKLIYSADGL